MSSTSRFTDYLDQFRLRLKRLATARGLAMLAAAALLITATAVYMAVRQGFPADIVVTARVLLLAVLGGIVYRFIVLPKRGIDRDPSNAIEARTPAFGGRVRTWFEIQGKANPLADLLAEDTLKVARLHPPEAEVRKKEFTLAYSMTALAVAALLFLALAGPGNYAYGVRHLWFGWAFDNLLPPQSIEVLPGNDGIRKGGTLNVRARMQGFDPEAASVHARFGDAEWQSVPMSDLNEGFEFTFYSVREPLEYYVSAANVRSETFEVRVVDLPVVEKLTLTYRYPEWTGKEPNVEDPGGDVRAIGDTTVEVRIAADRPMTAGDLVINDQVVALELDGDGATASFTVQEDGQYFVAARVGGEQIRLTDDYFVTLLDDALPQIEFARPGRDWSASSIEEVTASVHARDDFRLESLELRYSVNGGEWQEVLLPVDTDAAQIDHVFFLESMSEFVDSEGLAPGDLIAYYAVAEDRVNSARTDIFFIDVQPFDRRYSQSQQAGGQGGQQGQQQNEISSRQREIIVSTWNLIREQQEGRRNDPAYVTDNSALLARVQATLREQVETLAERTQARQLTASTEDIARFVEHLELAAEAMGPAAARLNEMALDDAILPEQEALQHLLAAEAVFTDINVSMSANNRGGGGGQAGRDLAEMFELEMDLEKNQYETGSRASPEAPQQALQEAADELAELARRQEQLARNMNRNQQATPAERWQQEMLRRDVEELRERLERMQAKRDASESQGQQSAEGQTGQSGEQSGEPSGQQSGQQSATQAANSAAGERQMNELQRRLDSAVRAMNDADEAMKNGAGPDDIQRAADEAQRQLEGARAQASEEIQRAMQASLADLEQRADSLHQDQEAMEQKLQEAIRGVSVGRNQSNRLESGMSILEEYAMAEEKRQLQSELQKLDQDARNTAQQIAESQPGAAGQLREALEKLRESEIESRMSVAAAYIEQGEAVYVAASESAVTEALREFKTDIERAGAMAAGGAGQQAGRGEQRDGLAEALAEARALRRELQQLADGNPGQADPSRPNAGQPDSGQTNAGGAPSNTGRDDLQRSTGVRVADLDTDRDVGRRADDLSRDVIGLFRDFRSLGVAVRDIEELQRLASDIRAQDFSGNPALLEEEARRALATVEQLELALSRAARQNDATVRLSAGEEIPAAHRDIIADYYRRLGQTEAEQE